MRRGKKVVRTLGITWAGMIILTVAMLFGTGAAAQKSWSRICSAEMS